MLQNDLAGFSDIELLIKLLINNGVEKGAATRIRSFLTQFDCLEDVLAISTADLSGVDRVSQDIFGSVSMLQQLLKRYISNPVVKKRDRMSDRAIADYCRIRTLGSRKISVYALLLDRSAGVLADAELHVGTCLNFKIYTREVMKLVIEHDAAGIVIARNEPSETVEPTQGDEIAASTISQACAVLDIPYFQYWIVSKWDQYCCSRLG